MANNAVVIVTHIIDERIIEKYKTLSQNLDKRMYDVVLIVNADVPVQIDTYGEIKCFYNSCDKINSLGYNPLSATLVPGSSHFPILRFFLDNRFYHHYWFIEYDVEFTGDWSVLMDDCDTNLADYDFLSCHVARFGEDNKEWTWWHRGNNCGYPLTKCVKGFNPICRYSGRALECLDRHQRKGYSAHSEVMITSCLYNHGMRIGDIGGTGEFTPQGYRNKYYVQGVGIHNGTMRWRPPYTME